MTYRLYNYHWFYNKIWKEYRYIFIYSKGLSVEYEWFYYFFYFSVFPKYLQLSHILVIINNKIYFISKNDSKEKSCWVEKIENKVNNRADIYFYLFVFFSFTRDKEIWVNWISYSVSKLKVSKWLVRLMEINGSILYCFGRKPFLVFLEYLFNLNIRMAEIEKLVQWATLSR